MTIPAKVNGPSIEDVITKGDLSKLTPEQRTEFYIKLCNRHGLDPLTQPFDWLMLNGKLTLYANRRCADQLRKINGISINIVSQDIAGGLFTVHVKASDSTGRVDEDLGVVALADAVKGEMRANIILKGITKAKRRVTLSISGLGFLDETEVEDIPAAAKRENPHVTRPEDIVEHAIEYDDDGHPIDNIPAGNPEIERMSKAMARPEYANLQADIRAIKELPVLRDWGQKNKDRVASLPTDWQAKLHDVFRDQMIDLGWEAKPKEKVEHEQSPNHPAQ